LQVQVGSFGIGDEMETSEKVKMETSPVPGECVYKKVYADVFYLYMCGITPIAFIGIVLNILNLIVLRMRSEATAVFLLRIIAGNDLCFLIVCVIYFSIRHMTVYMTKSEIVFSVGDLYIGPRIFYASLPVYFATLQTRNWLVVLITFERFLNIVFPLWSRAHLTKSSLGKVVVSIVVVSVLMNVPKFWSLYLAPLRNPCTGVIELNIHITSWDSTYGNIYYVSAVTLGPLFIIYILNTALIIAMRRAIKQRAGMLKQSRITQSDTSHDQTQATTMVLSVSLLFTICETPASLDKLAILAGIAFSDDDPFLNYGRKIGLLLIVFDSAANFVAYFISNRRFRKQFFRLFKPN
jgi:hypothetical protein